MGKNCKKDNKYKLAKVGKYVGSILFATVVTLGLTTQIQEIHADATTKTVSQSASTVSSSTSTSSAATSSSVVNSSSSNNATTAKSISSSDNSTAKTAAVQTKQNTDTKSAAAGSDAESVAVTAATQTKQQTNAKAAKTAASVTLSAQSSSTADSATSKAEQSQATSSSAASSSSAATNNDETADTNTDSETSDGFDVNYILKDGVTVKGVNKTALNEAMKSAYKLTDITNRADDYYDIYNTGSMNKSLHEYYDSTSLQNLVTALGKAAVMNRTLGISQAEVDEMTTEVQQAAKNLQKTKLDFSKLLIARFNESKKDENDYDSNDGKEFEEGEVRSINVKQHSAVFMYTPAGYSDFGYISNNLDRQAFNSQKDVDDAVTLYNAAVAKLVLVNEPFSISLNTDPLENLLPARDALYKAWAAAGLDYISDSSIYNLPAIDRKNTSKEAIANYNTALNYYEDTQASFTDQEDSGQYFTLPTKYINDAVNQLIAASKKVKFLDTRDLDDLSDEVYSNIIDQDTLYDDTYKAYTNLEIAAEKVSAVRLYGDAISTGNEHFDHDLDNELALTSIGSIYNTSLNSQADVDALTANLQKALTEYQQAVANHNKLNNTDDDQTNTNGQTDTDNQPTKNGQTNADNQTNKNNQPATNNQTNKNNQPAANNQTNKNNQPTTDNQANKTNQPAANNQTNKNSQVKENGHWYLYKNGVKQTGLQAIPDQHKTVYYNPDGQMQYGQQKVNGHWYLF
ncbi:MAG: hypothetical protein ABF475_00755, partial [Liquorilactobacillus nagelii]